MKRIMKEHFIMFIATMAITLIAFTTKTFAYQTQAYADRADELIDMGLSDEQIMDQLAEEFHGVDGGNNTGGIDGKYLDGTIAPNGSLAGSAGSGSTGGGSSSSGGSSTPSTPSHSHSYGEGVVTKDATCTSAGEMTYTCSCGKTKTSSLSKLDHDMSALVGSTPGTCKEIGTVTYKCKTCDKTETINTTYAEHIYIKSAEDSLESTCTKDGYAVLYCQDCNDKIETVVQATGHVWCDDYTIDKQATCTAEGMKSKHCKYCDAKNEETVIEPMGHSESEYLLGDATFWNDGKIAIRCEVCYEHIEDVVIQATGGIYRYIIVFGAGIIVALGIIFGAFYRKKNSDI